MATLQVVPQQSQPVGPGAYPMDPTPTSRRQYQSSPPVTEQSRSPNNARGSPPSSRRPSRRPSGGNQQYASEPHSSGPTIPRVPDPTARAALMNPHASNSPSYDTHRSRGGDERQQSNQQGGPPFSPPPRTSSNQRDQRMPLLSDTSLADRTVTQPDARKYDDRPSSSRRGNEPETASPGQTVESNNPAATAAQSRRHGPASPSGPQRATSTREPSAAQSPNATRDRPTINVVGSPSALQSSRQDSGVINRLVVDDPVVDLQREQARQLESVPGLDVSNTATPSTVRDTPKSRQDFSAQNAASSARRKETRFGEFILGQTLGEGEFGKVKLGWKTDGSVQVAIKLIRRESLDTNPSRLPKINREIKILETLHHPNIVKLHEMVETSQYIGMVLEYASGGELFDYILNHRYLKDNTARKLFAQLVSGVGYLHKKGIVHRDLKLENLLLDRNRNIIITDFGFANTFDPRDSLEEEIEYHLSDRDYVKRMELDKIRNGSRRGDLMATSCGSPCYAAPELVVTESLYTGRKVDVWSCGVILYAMLAGYLPFDDDPENPDGDNINQLYKYITTTPLTFPEYVTPHARDLLRRILVADPRKRADLFEVARHSWLSDFAHVVAQVTSSTTTVGEIANTTVRSDSTFAPGLVRSHSVREPTKTVPPTSISPVGGLSHQGKIDPSSPTERTEPSRDGSKRRTVQVEYVAPSRQTTRGEAMPPTTSPGTDGSGAPTSAGPTKSRQRAGTEGPDSNPRAYSATTKPLPADPRYRSEQAYEAQASANGSSQPPVSSEQEMAPPARPPKDFPRSVSDSTGVFGQPAASYGRPGTGGSMTSTGGQARLPSRGNSYSQPLAPTVANTNAQGRVTAPNRENRYNISAPMPVHEPYTATSGSRPSTQHYVAPPTILTGPTKTHKRSNTFGNFFRTGSISVPKTQPSQPQSPSETPQREKRHAPPPASMKYPIPVGNEPRQSTDSRRPSFNFSRRNRENSDESKQEKPRRFSLLPASFSFKSFTSSGSSKDGPEKYRPVSEWRQSNNQNRAPSRPQTMAYQKQPTEAFDFNQKNDSPEFYEGPQQSRRNIQAASSRKNDHSFQGSTTTQNQYSSRYQSQSEDYTPQPQSMGRPQLGNPAESLTSIQNQQHHPVYPPSFGSEDQEAQPRRSTQPGRPTRGPTVLTRDRRRFADAYEQDQEPATGTGGHHAGSSGAAKRVMDFFRRRGKTKTEM